MFSTVLFQFIITMDMWEGRTYIKEGISFGFNIPVVVSSFIWVWSDGSINCKRVLRSIIFRNINFEFSGCRPTR